MKDIKNLTLNYVTAFNNKSIKDILSLVDENIFLKDPANEISNKTDLSSFLKTFFENSISFSAKQIICEENTSVIHFDLRVNEATLAGVDIIEWESGRIKSIIAYLS